MGAAVAPTVSFPLLGWTLVVFFLGLGVCAHALDEFNGRPLRTRFSDRTLWAIAAVAIAVGAVVVIAGTLNYSTSIIVWAAVGLFLAIGYPVERPKWLHTDLGFAIAWGAYPVLASFWVQSLRLNVAAVLVAGFAFVLSLVQRSLSTPARLLRRTAHRARVTIGEEDWEEARLLGTWEQPLRLLTVAVPLLAVGLLLWRFALS